MSSNTDLSERCGDYDSSAQKQRDQISKIADSLGMTQECKRLLDNANSDNHFEMHANFEADALFMSTNGGMGLSNSNSDTASSLNESGCGTAMADIKRVMDAKYKIACDLNTTSVSTSQQVNANASINITAIQKTPPREPPSIIGPPPVRPSSMELQFLRESFSASEVNRIYQKALDAFEIETNSYNDRLALYAPPSIRAANAVIRNRVGVNLKTLTKLSESVKSKLKESSKQIAGTVAMNSIEQKAGVGSSNSKLNQMVSSLIESKDTEILANINTIQDSMDISVNASGNIEIFSDAGLIDLTGTEVTNDMSIELLTERISKASYDMGKTIASEVIRSATSDNTLSQELAGFEDIIAEVQAGLAARLAALSDSQNEYGGDDWMKYIVIILLLGGGGAIGGTGKMTPIKIIILLCLLYLILAWFLGWFPFNFFGFLAFRTEGLKYGYKNKRKKMGKNQSSITLSPRVEYLKRKTPYRKLSSLNGTWGGSTRI